MTKKRIEPEEARYATGVYYSRVDRDMALQLRKLGWTYKRIGEKYGVTGPHISNLIKRLEPDLVGDDGKRMSTKRVMET